VTLKGDCEVNFNDPAALDAALAAKREAEDG